MSEPNEVLALVRELVEGTNRTLASHKQSLDKLTENLLAAHAVAENHGQCLVVTQENLKGLTALVNAQTQGFEALRAVVLKLATHCFGPDESPDLPDVVN